MKVVWRNVAPRPHRKRSYRCGVHGGPLWKVGWGRKPGCGRAPVQSAAGAQPRPDMRGNAGAVTAERSRKAAIITSGACNQPYDVRRTLPQRREVQVSPPQKPESRTGRRACGTLPNDSRRELGPPTRSPTTPPKRPSDEAVLSRISPSAPRARALLSPARPNLPLPPNCRLVRRL